jgi:hypothetical protein
MLRPVEDGMAREPRKPYSLTFLLWWLPVVVAVAGGVWTVIIFVVGQIDLQKKAQAERDSIARSEIQQRENNSRSQLLDAQQPFLQKQLDLYFLTVQVTGRIVTLPRDSEAWKENDQRFWQLYWSELAMVESIDVQTAMRRLGYQVAALKLRGSAPQLELCVYELAHAIRSSIETRWHIESSGDYGGRCPTVNPNDALPIK